LAVRSWQFAAEFLTVFAANRELPAVNCF